MYMCKNDKEEISLSMKGKMYNDKNVVIVMMKLKNYPYIDLNLVLLMLILMLI